MEKHGVAPDEVVCQRLTDELPLEAFDESRIGIRI